jgi:hypothetical protein
VRVELIYPPLTDPTSGYHSLSYLKGYARVHGFADIRITDANIEAFHHSLECFPEIVAEARRRRAELLLSGVAAEGRAEAELTALLPVDLVDPAELAEAVGILQSLQEFYDYSRYQWAVERITTWMGLLGATSMPGMITGGFTVDVAHAWNPCSTRELSDVDLLRRINHPFQRYYDRMLLPRLRAAEPDVVGINVTYWQQLPFALWLGKLVRDAGIAEWVVCGGTEVSDVWKYLSGKDDFFTVFEAFDAAVVGEGESEFVSLLSAVDEGRLTASTGSTLINPRRSSAPAVKPLLRIETLGSIPSPDYDDLPFDKYLSPHRFVYYSPTRGCYWNKCTFCDYGLNGDSPTSPWRQDRVPKIVDELARIAEFAEFVYFSVDVLAPAMQLRLAEELVARGISLCWGAEIRLEKYWSPERCELLRRSGCVAVSVGFESASQRVLDLIDKGTRTERVLETIRNLTAAGIGVQMMGFTGFPTETYAEAMESVDFLDEHRDLWTFGGLGEFSLTPGAIVAKEPARFGLSNVRSRPDDDIVRVLEYDCSPAPSAEELELLRKQKKRLHRSDLNRPWLGGTDTPHTYFYHARYGTAVVDVLRQADFAAARENTGKWALNGMVLQAPSGYQFVRDADGERLRRGAEGSEWAFQHAGGRLVVLAPPQARFLLHIAESGDVTAAAREVYDDLDTARRTWALAVRKRIVVPAVPSFAEAAG